MNEATAQRWQRLAAAPAHEVSLAEGALLIAADAYEDLDIDAYLGRIDEMGLAVRRRLTGDIAGDAPLRALNGYLFDELGFSGNAENYYDARNSYLNDVIDRRLGIPITLAVLYIEVGRRAGLPLHGISFPMHFLVKCALPEGAVVLDPYARGAFLSMDDLKARLKPLVRDTKVDERLVGSLLGAARPGDIFARILRNLRAIHMNSGEKLKALDASNRILEVLPDAAEEYRDRGELYAELDCFRAALSDLRRYLELRPRATDAGRVNGRIAELEPLAARLN